MNKKLLKAVEGKKHDRKKPYFRKAPSRPPMCEGCGVYRADPPSSLCVGCQAYREHQR